MFFSTARAVPAAIAPAVPDGFNSSNLIGIMVFVAMILAVAVGVKIFADGLGKDPKPKTSGNRGFIVLIGAVVIAGAVGGMIWTLANSSVNFFGTTPPSAVAPAE